MRDWVELDMICEVCKKNINCVVMVVEGWNATFRCPECLKLCGLGE